MCFRTMTGVRRQKTPTTESAYVWRARTLEGQMPLQRSPQHQTPTSTLISLSVNRDSHRTHRNLFSPERLPEDGLCEVKRKKSSAQTAGLHRATAYNENGGVSSSRTEHHTKAHGENRTEEIAHTQSSFCLNWACAIGAQPQNARAVPTKAKSTRHS